MGIMTMGPSSNLNSTYPVIPATNLPKEIVEKIVEVPIEKIIHTKEIIEVDLSEVNDKIGNLYVELHELTEKLQLEIQTRIALKFEMSELLIEQQDRLKSEILKKHEELQTLKMQFDNKIRDLKSQHEIKLNDLTTSCLSQNQMLLSNIDRLYKKHDKLQLKMVLIGLGIILFSIIF